MRICEQVTKTSQQDYSVAYAQILTVCINRERTVFVNTVWEASESHSPNRIRRDSDGHYTEKKEKYKKEITKGKEKSQNRTKIENMGRIVDRVYHVHHISEPTRRLFRKLWRYSFNIQIRKKRNIRIRNHKGNRRNNQPVNRALVSLTREVTSVGYTLGTVTEERNMKDKFKPFRIRWNNMYNTSSIIQGTSSPLSGILRIHTHTLIWTISSISVKMTKNTSYSLHSYRRKQKTAWRLCKS